MGRWRGRIGGFAGCILVGGVGGNIGPWRPGEEGGVSQAANAVWA